VVGALLRDPDPMASQERWQMSGTAAQKYEQYVASFFVPWAEDLVQRAGLEAGLSVLDVACGTGVVTRAAGPVLGPTGKILASDLNEGMLAEARLHDVQGASVEWRQADATDLPFDSDEFDALLCQQGLQFVPDKATAVAEMHRVLRPGGIAAVSVWRSPESNPYISALADGLSRHLSPEAGQSMLAPCGLGDRDEFFNQFTAAGFASVTVEAVEIIRDPIDALDAIAGNLSGLPMAEDVAAMDPAKRNEMLDDMTNALSEYITDGILRQPMSAHIAVATA
jgi:ubiquinone/menaquinone biosynthesis C-methylase UbiE